MKVRVDSALQSGIKDLRAVLKSLDGTLHRLMSTNGPPEPVGGQGGRRIRLSPKARASMILQGRYMGYVRQLNTRQKAQVRRIREAKGVRVAIQRAKMLSAD